MRLPVLEGVIRRRLLVNFRVAPEVLQAQLPRPFRPKLQARYGVAGICLIRLEEIRPRHVPALLGVSSENAAHRIAVVWEGPDGRPQEGVFIPRPDTARFPPGSATFDGGLAMRNIRHEWHTAADLHVPEGPATATGSR